MPVCPTMLKWKTQADADSLYNTPPAYGIYICGKVFKWLKAQGGLEAMQARNQEKAALLYDFLDQSTLFSGTVRKEDRSLMNVPFVTGDADLDADMLEAELQAAFQAIVPFADACLRAGGRPAGAGASLIFNRDTIVNESQVIADVAGSASLLSRETLLEQHPWVEDVPLELERLRRENKQKGEAT